MKNIDIAALLTRYATDYAIFTVDAEGRITSWSVGAEHILGWTEQQALGQDFAVLFLDPDRAANTHVAELQKALTEGRAEDTRWHVRRGGDRFWANGVTMRLPDGQGVVKVMRDETPAKLAEDQRVLLLNELNHRLKNTLVTVQSIVDQTLRSARVGAATRDALTERLIALSEAHNVLVAQSWAGADLSALVERAVALLQDGERPHFTVDGPAVRLSPQQSVAMTLALHELATNAIKYGALSTPQGCVEITWNLAYGVDGGRQVTLLWRERGGPAVTPPARSGFGTRLIARSFAGRGEGRAKIEYEPDGLRCVIEVTLSQPEELPMMSVSGDPSTAGR